MELQQLIDVFYSNYNAGIDYEAVKDIYNMISDHHIEDVNSVCAFLFVKNKSGLTAYLYNKKINSLADVRKIIASRR